MNIYQILGAITVGAVIGTFAGVKLAQYLIVKRTKSLIKLLTMLDEDFQDTPNSLLTMNKDK